MPVWGWVLIVIGALVAGVAVWLITSRKRSAHLREQFGPEYGRVASSAESKSDAEAELASREERRESLDIRPLDEASRTRYVEEWKVIQAEFVDEPSRAVARADSLLQEVMAERGYPVEKFDQRAADLSVDHPRVVENYREGHRLATKTQGNGSATEELRQAMRHYRALFEELVESESESRMTDRGGEIMSETQTPLCRASKATSSPSVGRRSREASSTGHKKPSNKQMPSWQTSCSGSRAGSPPSASASRSSGQKETTRRPRTCVSR